MPEAIAKQPAPIHVVGEGEHLLNISAESYEDGLLHRHDIANVKINVKYNFDSTDL